MNERDNNLSLEIVTEAGEAELCCGMFNWVVKVVPHPPASPGSLAEEEKPSQPNSAAEKRVTFKDEVMKAKAQARGGEETSEESSAQGGMINWISNGFASALPQPPGSPMLSRANSEVKEDNAVDTRQGGGVIGWIVQGLGKVVPQPDEKYQESPEPDEDTEIHEAKDVPDAEPLPHIPVVDVMSEEEISEIHDSSQVFPPSMIDWIKNGIVKMVPQPEIHAPVPSDPSSKKSSSAPPKVTSPPPDSIKSTDEETTGPNVVGWIFRGLGRMMPQPVLKPREDNGQPAADVVVEEVDSDWENEKQDQPQAQNAPLSMLPQVLAMQPEDAEVQLNQCETVMETEEAAMAVQEDCPCQDQEDTTERAVNQDGQAEDNAQHEEDQKTTPANEVTHKASNDEQSPNIQEEESEEDSECLEDMAPMEDTICPPQLETEEEEKKVPSPEPKEKEAEKEPVNLPPQAEEPESEKVKKRDSLFQAIPAVPPPVTKQPEPIKDRHPHPDDVQ
ncbi:hypothetical protein JZ751_002691, partial [Albula glossodonta]